MKKYAIYGLLAVMAVPFCSCSDDEEILEPTVGYVDNKFAVPDDATGEEANLRREFYKSTGSYLIFSDLLSHEYVGKDAYGQDIYRDEYVDFKYNLTSTNPNGPELELLESMDEKRKGAELIIKYIYPKIGGGRLMPFSILPAESIQKESSKYPYNMVYTSIYSCWRCLAISVGDWSRMPESEQADYADEILLDIIKSQFTYTDDEVADFYDLSMEYSGEYLDDIEYGWDRSNEDLVHELGFLTYYKSSSGPYYDYLPYTSTDFDNYLEAVITRDVADFMAEFGDYALIVQKYNIIRNAVVALGLKL